MACLTSYFDFLSRNIKVAQSFPCKVGLGAIQEKVLLIFSIVGDQQQMKKVEIQMVRTDRNV